MREHYECAGDLEHERDVAGLFLTLRRITLKKLPVSYGVDFWMEDATGKCVGVAEFKHRTCGHDQYDWIMLSALKWWRGSSLASSLCVPLVLVFGFSDGAVLSYNTARSSAMPRVSWGGRTVHQRDVADIEPVVHLPVSEMKYLRLAENKACLRHAVTL